MKGSFKVVHFNKSTMKCLWSDDEAFFWRILWGLDSSIRTNSARPLISRLGDWLVPYNCHALVTCQNFPYLLSNALQERAAFFDSNIHGKRWDVNWDKTFSGLVKASGSTKMKTGDVKGKSKCYPSQTAPLFPLFGLWKFCWNCTGRVCEDLEHHSIWPIGLREGTSYTEHNKCKDWREINSANWRNDSPKEVQVRITYRAARKAMQSCSCSKEVVPERSFQSWWTWRKPCQN